MKLPMVQLLVKHGEGNREKEFLYDCESPTPVEQILQKILQISNLQLKIDNLALELEPSLAPLYGDKRGD